MILLEIEKEFLGILSEIMSRWDYVSCRSIKNGKSRVIMVKVIIFWNGVKKAFEMGFRRIEVEGDNVILI